MNQPTTLLIGDVPATFAVMPSQWADALRSAPDAPERMLWLCVLEDAIRCVQGCEVGATSFGYGSRRVKAAEAHTWLDSQATYPGSFRWICDTLDIEPDYLRQRIAEGITLQRRSPVSASEHPTMIRRRVRRAQSA